ncbi:SDR family NAD(P)-dependent oxidoreductase [Amaricoccus solimangrovi]|uniref:SDR family oxidoreductase n=1 Tax=Amaricoccus solimangrovi TaxID=2589815 RepID=A0A501X0Q9_9RHOB|nr:SDR family oxidoreductase [Amaricoccus solimangrovi]TPE53481.1 SDR family oxidoreductase [Amaricoccus solimangrovi]
MTREARRLALVTGGGIGIGRELVLALARAGHDVAFCHMDPEAAAAAVRELARAAGAGCLAIRADIGEPAEADRVFALVEAEFGRPAEMLVNNAGIQVWAGLLDLADADWDRVIRVNLSGAFYMTARFARRLVAAGQGGAIVNIGSGCNKLAFPGLVSYTASKGGVELFTKSAALELGPRGIRVNCVAPGAIETERTRAEAADYGAAWAGLTPLRRIGTPRDVAGAVVWLLSPAAEFVSGQTLWIDGGLFSQAPWAYPGS